MHSEFRLSELIDTSEVRDRLGKGDPAITAIAYDSRECLPGCVFFALPGAHVDGHRFIPQAIERGAAAIVQTMPVNRNTPDASRSDVVRLQVDNARVLLSRAAARFYGDPSRKLTVIGVTGTDGKSTTVYFLYQLLAALGKPAGFISTVALNTRGEVRKNTMRQSTPEAPDLHKMLAEMLENGLRYAIVEATSHGLSLRTARLADIAFDVAVCTNISHDHLEFHGTPEQYRNDKANLLRALDRDIAASPDGTARVPRVTRGREEHTPAASKRFAVLNRDDDGSRSLSAHTRQPVLWYSLRDAGADLFADELHEELDGSSFRLRSGSQQAQARITLGGRFNLENALAAALAVRGLFRVHLEEIAALLPALEGVAGRMITVTAPDHPFTVIVDYAHTPASFEKLFPMIAARTRGGIIPVFSSAGERDLEKRPILGEIAARYSRMVILADEDPRGEEPLAILEAVAAGCMRVRPEWRRGRELQIIPHRPSAIRAALRAAEPGDTVLLLGKGHEGNIIYADGAVEWDEEAEARRALQELNSAMV